MPYQTFAEFPFVRLFLFRKSNEILSKATMAEIIRDASVHIFSLDMKSALEILRNGATQLSLNVRIIIFI